MPISGSGGFLLIGTDAGLLQAHDAPDGALRWKWGTSHPFGGPGLAQVGETIFAASRDGYAYALQVGNGAVRWETVLPGINQTFEGTQLRMAATATAIALQYGKRTIVLNPTDGSVLWDYTLATDTYQGWVVAVGASQAYIVEQKFTVPITWLTSARAIRDGTVQWSTTENVTLEPAGDAGSSLVEADGVIYAYGFGLHALDSQTGSLLWEQKAVPEHHAAQIVVGRAVVLVAVRDYLGAFRRENGVPLWSRVGRHGERNYFEEFGSLLLLDGHGEEAVHVGRYESNPHGFLLESREPETGDLRWAWRGSSSPLQPIWRFRGAAGMLYVPTHDSVHAVRAADGQNIWQIPLEDASSTAYLAGSEEAR